MMTITRLIRRGIQGGVLLALLTLSPRPLAVTAQSPAPEAGKPFVVEYYYQARWGFADEFIRLFKKNHYPVLKKEQELGRILQVWASSPKYHTTEDGRWDYRVTIVWKNAGVAHDSFDSQSLIKQLFPDQETYKREEQRRFEILVGHWDVPVVPVELDK
ncbi:MAG TPA: hypothetical protein VJ302_33330 [Blastocatellia bacterium]|nr:hypothetical protein [Blastocatellia bacterium]